MSQLVELDPVLVRPLRRPERKPAPRRLPAAQRPRPVVMRTALGIILAAAAVTFAGRIASIAAAPILATYQTGREIKRLEGVYTREWEVNEQLKRDIEYLKTQAGVEQEARRRGWVKPGEVAISIVGEDPGPAAPAATPEAAEDRSIAGRIRSAVDTCLAVFGHRGGPR